MLLPHKEVALMIFVLQNWSQYPWKWMWTAENRASESLGSEQVNTGMFILFLLHFYLHLSLLQRMEAD